MPRLALPCLLAAALAWLAPAAPVRAAESYDACTGLITAVPRTISAPGVWCLDRDLAMATTSGNAITVNASNVVIDCNDHKLDGAAAGAATAAIGISAANRLNVTVRHCNVLGFQQGVRLTGSGGGHLVEDNRIDGATFVGIQLAGDGSTIRRNLVIDTGGSTTKFAAYGIYATGVTDVIDNTIAGVAATVGSDASAFGIYAAQDAGSSLARNRVRDVLHAGTRTTYGIFTTGGARQVLRDNEVAGSSVPGSIGVRCDGADSRARGSTVTGFPTPMSGCGDGGGNDLNP